MSYIYNYIVTAQKKNTAIPFNLAELPSSFNVTAMQYGNTFSVVTLACIQFMWHVHFELGENFSDIASFRMCLNVWVVYCLGLPEDPGHQLPNEPCYLYYVPDKIEQQTVAALYDFHPPLRHCTLNMYMCTSHFWLHFVVFDICKWISGYKLTMWETFQLHKTPAVMEKEWVFLFFW